MSIGTNPGAEQPLPWYRDPFRWLVIAFPLVAVVGGITTAVLAVRSFDGLVVDDYYNRGLAINEDLSRDAHAAALGLGAQVEWNSAERTLQVVLRGSAAEHYPARLNVSLIYATRAGRDLQLDLPPTGAGHYATTLAGLTPGHWYVHVNGPDWRLTDSLFVH
jgi:hypothetical protein